jgi:hypothetical protein
MADKDERNNGILGLDRAPVPKAPGDPAASDDAASTHQRHRRIVNAEEEAFAETHEDPDRQRSGATGIDMGSGGQGTHVSGK